MEYVREFSVKGAVDTNKATYVFDFKSVDDLLDWLDSFEMGQQLLAESKWLERE